MFLAFSVSNRLLSLSKWQFDCIMRIMERKAIAVLKEVSYQYPRSECYALKDVDLSIRRGEFLAVIGATGAGKTTLCLALNGVVPQFFGGRFFGSIEIEGKDTLEVPTSELAVHVGEVFEDPESQLVAISVENEIAFVLENLKIPRKEIAVRISAMLKAVRLTGLEKKHPHELSLGQKQRLAIAAALAARPKLLVLDEPTSQLDPQGVQEIFQLLKDFQTEYGLTVVITGHAAEEMAESADRVVLLSHGQVEAVGSPQEIYSSFDIFKENALRPPQVAEIFQHIRERNIIVDAIPVRLQDGIDAIDALQKRVSVRVPEVTRRDDEVQDGIVLETEDLHFFYPDGTSALQAVNLSVHKGEYIALLGQNGAGKSTLARHFLNLLQPSSGDVRYEGTSTRGFKVSELAGRIGYVAQNPDHQIFTSSVEEEVSFALKNLGYAESEVFQRTEESLSEMGLAHVRDVHPLSLPKGDRARVVIAAILAMQPEVVIFDEPTTGQDDFGAQAILNVSANLHRQGKTIIVISHHLYLLPEYARRAVVMGKGSILLDTDIRTAFHQVEVLRETYLQPPQAVLLAQEISRQTRLPNLLTPAEVAACFQPKAGD
jgi:energy-coupling factor transport system ATP-binding protein